MRGGRGTAPDRQAAFDAVREALRVGTGTLDLAENGLGVARVHLPGSGQRDTLRMALQELDAKFRLERPDLLTERGLLHPEALGCPGDAALLGDRQEVAQMP